MHEQTATPLLEAVHDVASRLDEVPLHIPGHKVRVHTLLPDRANVGSAKHGICMCSVVMRSRTATTLFNVTIYMLCSVALAHIRGCEKRLAAPRCATI